MKRLLCLAVLALCATLSYGRTCVCVATWEGGTLNIRSCPSTTCSLLGSEPPGQCYDYLGAPASGWAEIQYGAQVAYASTDYLSGPQECADGGADCFNTLCSSNSANTFRTCDGYGCGNYGASRGSRPHGGVDVVCSTGATIYAPITGTMGLAIPYGDGSCCDNGFYIDGTGSWSGHSIMVFYADPNEALFGTTVTQGQAVATHIGLHCGCYGASMTDHSHIQDDYFGSEIDPSSWLTC